MSLKSILRIFIMVCIIWFTYESETIASDNIIIVNNSAGITTVLNSLPNDVEITKPKEKYKYSQEELNLLSKIAMAEAEGESIKAKEMVIETVLNRVESDKFPDTIKEVIYQKSNGIYQFSPIGDGRFKESEPNNDCLIALHNVLKDYEPSDTLYFESCNGESWHSRNLILTEEEGNLKFYKE